ncbi:MAG: hypothetical protein H7Z42_13300 [Roseiflexaceae bacterium]|nr:hypothetical protein [Roseiflexaceae bacterium]
MSGQDPEYVRHSLPLIFDVQVSRKDHPFTIEALNGITSRIVELVEQDQKLQSLMRRGKIEWGLGDGTWES